MKFTFFRLIFLSSIITLLSSCLGTSNTPVLTSTDPSFVSLTFASNSIINYLNTAVFTLDGDGQTIVNVDSLPFKTRVDSVNPNFKFISTGGAIMYFPLGYKYKKDSAMITGKDTLDFRQTIHIKNYASDVKTYKNYYVKVNVHQVDPEKYSWNQVPYSFAINNITSQKAMTRNDTLFYYLNDGTKSYLYNSKDGFNWSSATLNNLPVSTPLNDMIQFNGKFFVSRDGSNIYSSSNGFTWIKKFASAFTFKSLLFVLNNQMWAVIQSADLSYHFANSSDGDSWNVVGIIPANFPVSDFATLSFSSLSGQVKVLVLGGYSTNGTPLNNRWSSENGVYWVDFSVENNTLSSAHLGSSLIWYDNKLLLFGQGDNSDTSLRSYYKQSIDEGLTWQTTDTLRNYLPADYKSRNYQSAVLFRPKTYNKLDSKDQILQSNRIFIIGGKSGSSVFSDIWTGKLNRKNFLLQ